MIGEALYDLLSTHPAIAGWVEDRVSAINFRQAEVFPALNYNTRSVVSLKSRAGSVSKSGILDVGILARDEVELEQISDIVSDALDDYQGVHQDYSLYIEASDNDFDENAPDLEAFEKHLQFSFTASKI